MATRKRKTTRTTKSKRKATTPPWDHEAPKKARHTHLTPAKKSAAKRRAQKAGRPYPNLVDNMRAARNSK